MLQSELEHVLPGTSVLQGNIFVVFYVDCNSVKYDDINLSVLLWIILCIITGCRNESSILVPPYSTPIQEFS